MNIGFLYSVLKEDVLYQSFSEMIKRERIPILGQIEISRKCNFQCPFCYATPDYQKIEMNTAEINDILRQAADKGCIYLLLTGGEPLLHPDFVTIYKVAVDLGIRLFIETNAYNLSKSIMDLFNRHPPVHISISLYGASDNTYKSITGIPCYDTVVRNIKWISDSGYSLSLRTPISKLNISELDLLKMLSTELGITHSFNFHLFPKQNGVIVEQYIGFSIDEIKTMVSSNGETDFALLLMKQFLSMVNSKPKINCYEGINSFYINAYAELIRCTFYWSHIESLRSNSFSAAWDKATRHLHLTDVGWLCQEIIENGYCKYWDKTLCF